MVTSWICPYCKFKNPLVFTEADCFKPTTHYCDCENGGCGELVAIQPRYWTGAMVFTLEMVGPKVKGGQAI